MLDAEDSKTKYQVVWEEEGVSVTLNLLCLLYNCCHVWSWVCEADQGTSLHLLIKEASQSPTLFSQLDAVFHILLQFLFP